MAAPPREESDDFSLFLHQIMLRSSSSSASPSFMDRKTGPANDLPGNLDCGVQVKPVMVSGSDRAPLPAVSSGGWSSGGVFASLGTCFGDRVVNVPSSSVSVGTGDNDLHEYDCESEGFEGAADEALLKPTAGRCSSSSKRSRAAEVHNQSEKRRRSRINEKMKALQNLIPNSNKTDKASMLDEAIDYLKQLQLQVQMLTMRNGLSLYPMCLPGGMQPNQNLCEMKMMDEGNVSLASLLAPAAPAPRNLLFTPTSNYNSHKQQASIFNLPLLNDSESAHQNAFRFPLPPPAASPEGNFMEEKLPCPQSSSFDARASRAGEDSLEACFVGGDKPGDLFLSNPMEFGKVERMSQGDNHGVEELD